jgi:hypothetical protein
MTFQALATTTTASGYDDVSTFDPSDEGEIARIKDRTGLKEEPVDEYERSFIAELGLDAEFFESN